MKRLNFLVLGFCLMLMNSVAAQESKGAPPAPQTFAETNTGPKCGELEEWGRSAVDGCMEKPATERPECVNQGKKEFFRLLTTKYGLQCRFVGEIVGKYAQNVGLEVREGEGPERVASGPNPANICPRWEEGAKRAIGQCGSVPVTEKKACGMRLIGVLQAEIANQPDIMKICPNLEQKIDQLATAALGNKIKKELGEEYKKRMASAKKPGGCNELFIKFKGGIDRCASGSNPGACLGKLKAEVEKVRSEPKNNQCGPLVGDSLLRYAYSKPTLRIALDKMRGDEIRHAPPQAPKKFAEKNPGPKCGELEQWGRNTVDGCMARPAGERAACVERGKKEFFRLLMRKYGPQCRFVGKIVGKYAASVGLEVRDSKEPERVAKGPNPAHICPKWIAGASKVIGQCGRMPRKSKKACGIRAVEMFTAEIANQPDIFKICPNLNERINKMAEAAFGKELKEDLGKRYQKQMTAAKKPGGCIAILKRFKGGIDSCARSSSPRPCVLKLKAQGDKVMSNPKNSHCGRMIGSALFRYAYSKPKLRRVLDNMRGDRVRHDHGPKTRVAGSSQECLKLETKTRAKINRCAGIKGPKARMNCVRGVKADFDRALQKAGECGNLDDKMGRYARSKGLRDPKDMRTAVRPKTHGKLHSKGPKAKCSKFIRWVRGAFNYCKNKDNPAKCARRSESAIKRKKDQLGFNEESCPSEYERFEEMGDQLRLDD